MSWQTPLAWLGLAVTAVPILVHLLTRQQAIRVAFPTLRFLSALPAVQVRRHRLTDGMLLAVRIAILAAAVAALAGPLIDRRSPPAAGAERVARAIVIDTSASVDLDAARRAAAQLSGESAARVIESPRVPEGVRAATVSLATAAGAQEVAIVSDFQIGAVSTADLASVPGDVGIRLVRVAGRDRQAIVAPAIRTGARTISTAVDAATAATNVVWTATASANRAPGLTVLAPESDRVDVDAAIEAAIGTGVPADPDPGHRTVTIILPGAAGRETRLASARATDRPWMFDIADRIARDRTVLSAASGLAMPPSILARRGAASQESLELYPTESDRVYVAAVIA